MVRRKLPVAREGEIVPGRTKAFRFGTHNGIAYNDGGTLKAYVNRCTHMGGPVALTPDGKRFRCQWHLAEFESGTGKAVEGEAPRGTFLKPIELTVEDGQVYATMELPDDPFSF